MKQPKNSVSVEDVGTICDEWTVWVDDTFEGNGGIREVCIGYASSKKSALRLAIKRLDRLKRDCERELAKEAAK